MERPKTHAEAKAHIDQIRKDQGIDNDTNSNSFNHFSDTLEQSLKLIAEGLYQQPTRFLLELLQNADDCSYGDPTPQMNITYSPGHLRVDYNELGFTRRDVGAICKVSSTKGQSTEQTGEKGIGFKSVFKMADVVWVLSGSYSFQFDTTRKLGMVTPQWANFPMNALPGFTTSILLQLRRDCKPEELIKEMRSMSPKHLLFLRRLRQINITIRGQDVGTWETTIRRDDSPYLPGSTLTTTTLSQTDKRWEYWMYKHKVKIAHSEPKREHCTESIITLAFPVCVMEKNRHVGLPDAAEPVVEDQDVHAMLPVRNYGLKFVVNADFLLVANREDIVSSSDWNQALQHSVVDAFKGAIRQLNSGTLRYTWPRYVPAINLLHSFQDVENGMKAMLLHGEFLESINETPITALSARYVPQEMRGQGNLPLTFSPRTGSKYLSLRYTDEDWGCLQQLGVRELSETEFLKDLEILIADNGFVKQQPEEWHEHVAKLLTRFSQDNNQHKRVIEDLQLIPLSDGGWVSASVGNIFFPESEGPAIPSGIGVLSPHAEAMKNRQRRMLFQTLGVQSLSVSKAQSLVIEAHSKTNSADMAEQDILVSQAVFLFRTQWSSELIPPPFWVVSKVGYYVRADQAYLDTTTHRSFGQHFDKFTQRFVFLHPKYHDAVKPDEKERWLYWLCTHLGVLDTSQLLPKFQDLTVQRCSVNSQSSLDDLIDQTVFLFRTNWVSEKSPENFWVRTNEEKYVRAREAYYLAEELHSRRYFNKFRQDFPFLHAEYYRAVQPSELVQWQRWLRESLGVWDVPRLVSNSDPGNLSADFQRILTIWPSRDFLMLLREEWGRYQLYFLPQDKNDKGNTHGTITGSAGLREKLKSALVSCSDGSSRPLCETFTVSIFPEIKDQTILSPQLLLDIPEPQDAAWDFLETFGVTIKDDITIYLRCLDLERNRGSNASKDFVAWLYGKIQEKADESPKAVSEAFKKNCIFIPSSHAGAESIWVEENECVWDGTELLQKFHVLKRLYSQYERLFTKFLTHTHTDLDVLVSELESISMSTPLNLIVELFKEISTRHVSRLGKDLADRLRSHKIFPIDEGNAMPGFDDLCSGLDESEWYIADRPQYRNSFRGVVSLISFSPWDILTMTPLIKALGFEGRLLSKRATPRMRTSGNVELDRARTKLFRAKSKFIARMMPKSLAQRKKTLVALNTMEVFLADKVLVEWTITSTDFRLGGREIQSQVYDETAQAAVSRPDEKNGIQLYLNRSSISFLPYEIATQLADICGIGDQSDLVYFVLSQPSLSYIEQYLDQQYTPDGLNGELDGEIDVLDDFKLGATGEDDVTESAALRPNSNAGDNQEIKQSAPLGRRDGVTQPRTTTLEHAQSDVVLDIESTTHDSNRPLDNRQGVSRHGYASLGNQYVNAATLIHSNQDELTSSAGVENPFPPLPVLAYPRIGAPHVTFISDPQELPSEDFSENAPGGNTFPGRAQVSESESRNIIVATSPDIHSDPDAAFAGELLVSKLLEQQLGTAYLPEKHWTSHLRTRADHTGLLQPTDTTATFTLQEVPAVTSFLLRSSFREAMWWWLSCPVYHIQVQTTIDGQDSPFVMSTDSFERVRSYRTGPWPSLPDDVLILVRIADLYTTPTAFFYVDPYRMYASGQMRVRPNKDFFSVEIPSPKPQIALRDFGHTQSLSILYGQEPQLIKPVGWGTLLGNCQRRSSHNKTYVYQSLTIGTIRLLELFPGDTLDDLRGKLHHVPLSHTSPYLAISYAWGFGVKSFVLATSEGGIGITTSLCLGLRHLREKENSVLIWADAICIDQSNTQEKNKQVRLMPRIFATAKQVSVWTGSEANGSDSAIEYLCRMAITTEPEALKALLVPEANPVWNSVNSFFNRSWFQRAWIAQELVLARQVIVVCGKKSAQWDHIYTAARICSQQSQISSTDVMKQIGKNVSAVLSLGDLRLSYHKGEDANGRRLLTLFQRFHHSKATLQRDKLFALLGVANDAQDLHLDPDYASRLEDIVKRYAGVFVGRGNAIELLYHAGWSSHRFPSWIPDWITNTPKQTISTWLSTPHSFTACPSSPSYASLASYNSSILITKGYFFDSVEKVSNTSYEKAGFLSYLKELWDLIKECSSYPGEESVGELKWKIPIGGLVGARSATGEGVDFRVAYQALTEYLELREQNVDWKTEVMQIRALVKIKHFLLRPEELRRLLWPYLHAAREFAEKFIDARACRTRQGYIGIVPGTVLPGDIVAMIWGSAVPFLIRESQKRPGHCILLGEGYIHGIMHGMPGGAEHRRAVDIRLL